jgi:transcriptional regulator with XRE-family HTH domain
MKEGGRHLRGRRTDLTLSLEDVAEAIGKTVATVRKYEAGASDPMRGGVSATLAAVLHIRSLSALYLRGEVEAM